MPNEDINTTLRFDADITDFKAAMQEATRATKLANSEFKAVSAGMDDWAGSTDGLSAKLSQLATVQQAEERKLAVLKEAYRAVVEEQGENSAAAVDLATKINNQQAVVNKTAKEYDNYSAKLEEVEKSADGAADDIKKAGDTAKDAGEAAAESADGWSIAKDVISDLVSNVISWAVDSLMQAAEATREYRRDIAQLSENAASAGHDMKTMKDTLADVAAVTGETDAAMEGLNMLMASGLKTDQLVLAADALSGAATKFDGVKFEGIAEGLQETLAVGEAVGPFAEIIERTGGDLEKFNEGLAKCTTQADKTNYVMDWLANSGLKDVHDAYVQNNSDLVEAEKAQFRLNESMAGLGSATEPIQTALTNITATFLEKLAPAAEQVIGWLLDNMGLVTPIVTGLAVAVGVLAAKMAFTSTINGVTKAFSLLTSTMKANPFVLVASLVAGLVTWFITAYQTNDEFRKKVDKAWAAIKNGIGSAIDWIGKKIDSLVKWWKELPGKISSAISSAVGKVTTWGTNVYNAAKKKVTETVSGVTKWFKELPGKIASAISGAVDKVVSWGKSLASKGKQAASDLVSAVVDKVKSLPDKMVSIGSDLAAGVWEGMSNSLSWIKNKISGWVGDVKDFLLNLFDINSPSGWARDWLGFNIGAGAAVGLEDSFARVKQSSRKLKGVIADTMDVGPFGIPSPRGVAAGGRTIIFNQTNNSPRELSRREIYRQTHNALAFAGGM